jgi:hypothetical protein
MATTSEPLRSWSQRHTLGDGGTVSLAARPRPGGTYTAITQPGPADPRDYGSLHVAQGAAEQAFRSAYPDHRCESCEPAEFGRTIVDP